MATLLSNKVHLACQLLSDAEWEIVKNALLTAQKSYEQCAKELRATNPCNLSSTVAYGLAQQCDRQVSEVDALITKIGEWW